MAEVISFEKALEASAGSNQRHLLLGNGFSIACRPDIFIYGKLFERANFDDIPRARKAFDALNTTDFERVIKALRDFASLAPLYGGQSADATADAHALREVLVRTVANSHPARPSDIKPKEYAACRRFLANFNRIFTLNYDLLLYWALMQDEIEPEVACDDGFRKPEDNYEAPYVTWEPDNTYNQNVYYLHGALHLFDAGFELQKYTWVNTGMALIDQIRSALEDNRFPVFVAEGTSGEKFTRIRHSDFLAKAYRSFLPIGGALFVYGHSLAENDDHILKCIARGKTTHLFVSLYGDPASATNKGIIRKATALAKERHPKRPLEVAFYDAASTPVWK